MLNPRACSLKSSGASRPSGDALTRRLHYHGQTFIERGDSMTVCVAAICQTNIFGAADQMLTAGNIQFEPPASKIVYLTNSIVAMLAGDSAIHSEIGQVVKREIHKKIQAAPDVWVSVNDVADLFAK